MAKVSRFWKVWVNELLQ